MPSIIRHSLQFCNINHTHSQILPRMESCPQIPDCPACLQPLTCINGVKPDLVATPCGHLFHKDCLPPPSHSSFFSLEYWLGLCRCKSCQKHFLYTDRIRFYSEMSDSDPVEMAEQADFEMDDTTSSEQNVPCNCGHEDCVASGQMQKDYEVLVKQLEELEEQMETEKEAVMLLQGLVDKAQIGPGVTGGSQGLKRKWEELEESEQ